MAAIAPVKLAASILSADLSRLGQQAEEAMKAGIASIHVDVMDGVFVPNLAMGAGVVKALQPLKSKYQAKIHAHLMISAPDRYLADFVEAGADGIIVHVEACPHLFQTLRTIHSLGAMAGIALNPATPLAMLEEVVAEADLVLVMTVEPGFGGQELIPNTLDKIARLRRLLAAHDIENVEIAVDGGINVTTAAAVVKAGAGLLVAGSQIFNAHSSVEENLQALLAVIPQLRNA